MSDFWFLNGISLHAFRFISFHFISLHFIAFRFVSFHFIACISLQEGYVQRMQRCNETEIEVFEENGNDLPGAEAS